MTTDDTYDKKSQTSAESSRLAALSAEIPDDVVLRLAGARKSYVVGETIVEAIRGITLDIKRGEFVIVLGASGSGKSTLLSLIAGLEHLTEGEIFIDGNPIGDLPEDDLTELRRSKIGIVFQFFELHEGLSAADNIELPMLIAEVPPEQRQSRVEALLEAVDLSDRAANLPHEMSGGEKQRVGIARALANTPEILLADEPIGDLDSKTGNAIIDLLVELNKTQGVTIIMVTHDLEAVRPGMRLLKLDSGHLVDDYIYTEKMDQTFKDSMPTIVDDSSEEHDITMGIAVNADDKIICPVCNRVNSSRSKFCGDCGAKFE